MQKTYDHPSQPERPGLSGWQKWALMSVVILGLSSIVLYFNFRIFTFEDALPYVAVVLFLVLLSFIITIHIKRGPVSSRFLTAAFTFEVLLCVVLGVNAAYSLKVMREMSVAGQTEASQRASLDSVSKLKGARNQRDALKKINSGETKSRQATFAEHEKILFWILIAELSIGLLAMFVLIGLSVFDKDLNGVPDFLEARPVQRPVGFARSEAPPVSARETDRPKDPPRHWI